MSEDNPRYYRSITAWRSWLGENHADEKDIWIIIQKKASKKPVILPSEINSSARTRLLSDHTLFLLRGVNRCMNSSSLSRFIFPSIQPWATASCTASLYRIPSCLDAFFWMIIQIVFFSVWFSLSQRCHSVMDLKYFGLYSDNSVFVMVLF